MDESIRLHLKFQGISGCVSFLRARGKTVAGTREAHSSSGRKSKISPDETENSMYWSARFHWPAPGSHPDVIVMTRNHWHARRPYCLRGPQPALCRMTESGFGKERPQRQFWARLQRGKIAVASGFAESIMQWWLGGRGDQMQHCINMHPNQRNQPVNKNSSQHVACFVCIAHRNLLASNPEASLLNPFNLRSSYQTNNH